MKKTYCKLIRLILLFLLTAFNSVVYAQQSIDFTFQRTGPNHSVLALPIWHPVIKTLQENDSIPREMVLGFEGDSLEAGDLVGVFYTNQAGDLKCAGSLKWKSNDFVLASRFYVIMDLLKEERNSDKVGRRQTGITSSLRLINWLSKMHSHSKERNGTT